jgi:hypothetical protein
MIATSLLHFPASCLSVQLRLALIVVGLAGSDCRHAVEYLTCRMLVSAVSTTKWNAGNCVKLYTTNQASVTLPTLVLENLISNLIRTHNVRIVPTPVVLLSSDEYWCSVVTRSRP